MNMTEDNAEDQQISYDEFTLNFKLQEDIPVEQFELSMFNYEFDEKKKKNIFYNL